VQVLDHVLQRLPPLQDNGTKPSMDNLHLFELINAGPGLEPVRLTLAVGLAQWLIYLMPLIIGIAWVRGDHVMRTDLLQLLLAVAVALAVAQFVAHVWPQPRPFMLHVGTQYLGHSNDPGLPSDHVTVFWSLALSALATRRLAVWCFPLLAIGLLVGWSRVLLGVHFPYDILAALPVALVGATAARGLQTPLRPVTSKILCLYDRFVRALRSHSARAPRT
jgi:undecaprenyl-diphosphatase